VQSTDRARSRRGSSIHGAQGSYAHGQVTFGKDAAIADPLGWRLIVEMHLNSASFEMMNGGHSASKGSPVLNSCLGIMLA
jgi:hypothetical protein